MQLVVDDHLQRSPLERYEDDGVRKERYRCLECDEESLWVIYNQRSPIAGCTESDCSVGARMGLLETLEHLWDEERWGELPEDRTARTRTLNRTLAELSAHHVEEEEQLQREASQREHQRYKRMEENRDGWKTEAERLASEAALWQKRAGDLEGSIGALRAKLEHRTDQQALRRGLGWGSVALVSGVLWLEAFLGRARAEMFFEWGALRAAACMVVLGSACAYLAFSVVYRDSRKAAERDELPRSLHEQVGWRVGLRWSGKVAVCAVVPYIAIGMVGESALLWRWIPRDGVEWLLICIVAGLSCALALCAWMAEDLR